MIRNDLTPRRSVIVAVFCRYAATFGRGVYTYDFNGLTANTPEVPLVASLALIGLAASSAVAWRRRRRQRGDGTLDGQQ